MSTLNPAKAAGSEAGSAMIELEGVTQIFHNPDGGRIQAVKDVTLTIRRGEIFGIIGRSGAGKSTLVRAINFLARPTQGTVKIDGAVLNDMDDADLRALRRQVGMIFQHFNLLSSRTVYENIALPLELCGKDKAAIREKVEPLIDLVGLREHADKYPAQLSGGQKQRVGIARALANDPKVILSDEATSALDPETTRAILDLLRNINRKLGVTIVMITHQMEVVRQICDRVAVMNAGEVIEEGEVLDIFRQPKHQVTRTLLSDVIRVTLPDASLAKLRGYVAAKPEDAPSPHLVRLAYASDTFERPLVSHVSRKFGVDINILQGQIDEVQGKGFGTLTVLVECRDGQWKEIADYIRTYGVLVEELEHVI